MPNRLEQTVAYANQHSALCSSGEGPVGKRRATDPSDTMKDRFGSKAETQTATRPHFLDTLHYPDFPDILTGRRIVMSDASVTSAAFQKNFGRYREVAIREPLIITNHGRESLVLLSADEYRRLKQRDREALLVSELGDTDIEAIGNAAIPQAFAAFDHELES
jgi:prevent-host-death family protein